ncbi:hypothetical protein PRK78_002103 [Emydomyces testavorans]|uniref:Nucleolar 27S pre-rRNA processing Urb2/Npa2 C-terminal domain-containing protein n=1 Tax=Emydomyces testavorans TaxID=2070801 RepID=A0AAF0DDU6_9EURO|nr:hypothetical protein PRK78_002103 [Emydomyces testavorans]
MAAQSEVPTSYQALLELEKRSHGDPKDHLREAARIIGADLDSDSWRQLSRTISSNGVPAAAAPKEEWVLRWLMKKLKAPTTEEKLSYRCDQFSWILLCILLHRIPPRTLATILTENKFLNIVQNSLEELSPLISQPAEFVGQDGGSALSKTSSGSRKRKRMEDMFEGGLSCQPSLPLDLAVDTILSVAGTVEHLVALVDRIPVHKTAVKSQLKLVLRGSLLVTADLLSQALQCATAVNTALRNNEKLDPPKQLFASLSAIIEIWKLRSDRVDDSASSSDDQFASKVLEPAIKFLGANRKNLSESETGKSLVQNMERLIVLHVVLPIRGVFFAAKLQEPTSGNDGVSLSQVKVISHELASRLRSDSIEASILPVLLDIAIRALPRDTFRRKVNEAPWLETFFVALSARAGYHLSTDSHSDASFCPTSLQDLFRVLIDRKMTLSLSTLIQYAIRFTGLHRDYAAEMQWMLISQIIEIDADVFLPNSGFDESKRLFESLVGRVTSLFWKPSKVSSDTYTLLKEGIILPLLKGFSRARDGDTILQTWIEQLRLLDNARSGDRTISLFSIWEDDDVSKAYGTLMASNVSASYISSQIDKVMSTLSKPAESSEIYAHLVILDSILLVAHRKDGGILQGFPCDKIFETLVALMSSTSKLYWRWRLWRILQNLVYVVARSNQDLPRTAICASLPTAKNIFERFCQNSGSSADVAQCQEAFWSFRFVVFLSGEIDDSMLSHYLDDLTSILISLLEKVPSCTDVAWNERVETLKSPETVSIGALTAFSSKRSALGLLSTECRRRFLTEFLITVAKTIKTPKKPAVNDANLPGHLNAQLAEVWFGFASLEFLLSSSSVVYDMTFVLYEQLKKDKLHRHFLVQSLLNVPIKLVPRHQRGSLLDLLEEIIFQGELDSEVELDILTLMTKLIDAPKSPARITSDERVLWEIARSISIRESDTDLDLFAAFKQLHKAVLDKVLASSEGKLDEYGLKVYNDVAGLEKKIKTANFDTMEYYLFILSLHSLHTHQTELDDKKRETIRLLQKDALIMTLSELKRLSRQLKTRPSELEVKSLIGILGVVDTFQFLLHENEEVLEALRKLEKYAIASDCDEAIKRTVKQRMLAYKIPGSSFSKTLIGYSSFPVQQLQARDQELFIHHIHLRLSSLTKAELVDFLRDLRSSRLSGDEAAYRLLLIGMVIGLLEPIDDRESPASLELTSTFTDVTEVLLTRNSIETFCLAAESLDILLRTHPRSISQWNVDNILAKVAIIVSPSGPTISFEYAGTIYTRLCRLLGTLFGLYRKKLSGRSHLVLPVMQQLLRCLCVSDSRPNKSQSLAATRPRWIGSLAETSLETEHATQYTRLLTSLCDPTVSAVENHRGGPDQNLTDNTKKVKSLAGQYLQYLIMEYAGLQLRGRLVPEMKTALMPGLYAVLDVMSKNTMRAMNAAMDASSRAVFKGLYDDYVKFGKWNHD